MRQFVSGQWAAEAGRGTGHRVGRVVSFDVLRRQDAAARRVLEAVATAHGVPVLLLLHPSRCTAEVALARQVAMYLMHVVLQRTYADVGRVFGRDRTTVAHACAQVEDLRDRPTFDAAMTALEAALEPTDEATGEAGRAGHAAR